MKPLGQELSHVKFAVPCVVSLNIKYAFSESDASIWFQFVIDS